MSTSKRGEFRKYLENTGVMDALTKVLVMLYEETDKPENPLEYIRNKISDGAEGESVDSLKAQLEEARNKNNELEKKLNELLGEPSATEVPTGESEAPPEPSN